MNKTKAIDMGTIERTHHMGGVRVGARVQTDAGIVLHRGAAARIECVLDALRDTGLLNGMEGSRVDRTSVGRSRYDQGLWLRTLFMRAGLSGVQAMDLSRKTGDAIKGGAGPGISDDTARARMKFSNIVRELGPFAEDVTNFTCFDTIRRGEQHLTMLRKGLDRLCVMRS